jgi:hypothetical protein
MAVNGPTTDTLNTDTRLQIEKQNDFIMRELEKMKAENQELRSLILH